MTTYTKDHIIGELLIISKDVTRAVQNNTDVLVSVQDIVKENVRALNDNNAYHQKVNEVLIVMGKKINGDGNLIRFLIISLVALLFISYTTFAYLLGGKELLPFLPKLPL